MKEEKKEKQDNLGVLQLPWFSGNTITRQTWLEMVGENIANKRTQNVFGNFTTNKINMKKYANKVLEIIKGYEYKQWTLNKAIWVVFAIILILLCTHLYVQSVQKEEKMLIEYKRGILEMQENINENEKTINTLQEENQEKRTKIECLLIQIERILMDEEVKEWYCDTHTWANNETSFEQTKENEKKREDRAKENCYEKKANLDLNWKALEDFCENPYRLNEFDTQDGVSFSKVVEKKQKIHRKWWAEDDERQKLINYVYEKWGEDGWDIVLTWTGENGIWTTDRKSDKKWYDGNRAYWICQLYYTWHKDFINSKEFQDPYKQIDYCLGVWRDAKNKKVLATTFQAYPWRSVNAKLFDIR